MNVVIVHKIWIRQEVKYLHNNIYFSFIFKRSQYIGTMLRSNLYHRSFLLLLRLYFTAMPMLALFIPKPLGVVTMVLGAFALLGFAGSKIPFEPDWRLIAFFTLLILFGCLGVLWSPDPSAVMERALKLIPFFAAAIFLFAVVKIFSLSDRVSIFRYLPFVIAIASILALVEYKLGFPMHRLLLGHEAAEHLKPVILNRGMVFMTLMLWPACFYLAQSGKKKYTWPLILLVFAAVFLTFSSQSALFGLIAGLICWKLTSLKKYQSRVIKAVFLTMAAGALFAPWLAKSLYSFQPAIVQEWQAAAVPQRMTIWNAVAIKALEHPFFGYGFEATRTLKGEITRYTQDYTWEEVYHPHNLILQLWVEMGLAGVLLFIGFLFMLYKRIIPCADEEKRMILSCFATTMAIGLVGYGLWQSWWLGAVLSMAVACILLKSPMPPHGKADA